MTLAKGADDLYAVWQIESLWDYIELLDKILLTSRLTIFRGQPKKPVASPVK